jgi:hypothetical protein
MTHPTQKFVLWGVDERDMRSGLQMTFVKYHVLRDTTPCGLEDTGRYWYYGDSCCLHSQNIRAWRYVHQVPNLPNDTASRCLRYCCQSSKLPLTHWHSSQSTGGPQCILLVRSNRRMRWSGHVARIAESRNTYRILVGKPEGRIILIQDIPLCSKYNIKMEHKMCSVTTVVSDGVRVLFHCNTAGRRPLGRPRHAWWIILKWILKKHNRNAWTGLIWLGIGTRSGLLRTRWWTFRFHQIQRISRLAEELLAFLAGLCSLVSVRCVLTWYL